MIKTYKPATPGLRTRKTLVYTVDDVRPEKSLIVPLKGPAGRSNGRISVRHKQRGSKKYYRIIDFKRDKREIEAVVDSIQYDPNRGPNIALLNYKDGEKRYILAPEGLVKGMTVLSSPKAEIEVGNALPLSEIPLGTFVHNVEINPDAGGKIARGAGGYAQLVAKDGGYVNVKLPSGEIKKLLENCYATVGTLTNMDQRNTRLGTAGKQKYLGVRPAVRGVAMGNPKGDHPHGGSYKKNGVGMSSPKSPWGWKTRGVKSRSRKHTDYSIVKSRRDK